MAQCTACNAVSVRRSPTAQPLPSSTTNAISLFIVFIVYSSPDIGRRRPAFFCESMRFLSSRFVFADLVGRVATLGLSGSSARSIRCANISKASCLFLHWLLCFCEETRMRPWASMRRRNECSMSDRWASVSHQSFERSNRTSTFVSSLLTFCPPGPELREVVKLMAERGITSPDDRRMSGMANGSEEVVVKRSLRQRKHSAVGKIHKHSLDRYMDRIFDVEFAPETGAEPKRTRQVVLAIA